MSCVWNLLNPLRTGRIRVTPRSGRELYGTVIRQGVNNKTVTVRLSFNFYNEKYKKYFSRNKNHLAHDEENFCRPGDKVIIQSCVPLSSQKHFFVRQVIKKFPRSDFYDELTRERRELMAEEFRKAYGTYRKELSRQKFKNKRLKTQMVKAFKEKATTKATQNVARILAERRTKRDGERTKHAAAVQKESNAQELSSIHSAKPSNNPPHK